MGMTGRTRIWTLLLLAVALVAMILLSASLSDLELLPGQPFSFGTKPPVWGGSYFIGGGTTLMALLRVVITLSFLLLPLAIIYFIVSPEARKQALARLVPFLLLFAIFYLLMRAQPDFTGRQAPPPGASPDTPLSAPALEFTPNPPPWLTFAMSLGLAILIAVVPVGALWFVWRHRHRPASPLRLLARQAQDALDALLTGADLKDTVMRCYFEMVHVLNEQRGIKRQRDMTPREFERRLAEVGLPRQPVQRLTRLFEEVRYGTKVPSKREEDQAIACLTAIVEACRNLP